MIKPQSQFPLMEEYKKVFEITKHTIFAYDGNIYTNDILPYHLIIHEETHLKQQDDFGLYNWVDNYLTSKEFRLKMEVEAYRKQLASIKNREFRNVVRLAVSKDLASSLYGNIVSYDDALKLLKI